VACHNRVPSDRDYRTEVEKADRGPNTKNLWLIATMMIVIAVLLAIAEKVGSRRRQMKDLGIKDAMAVGFAQVLSLMPGSSRSGSTIMAGLLWERPARQPRGFRFYVDACHSCQRVARTKGGCQDTSRRQLSAAGGCNNNIRNSRICLDMVSS